MATLSSLVETVARVEALDPSTVALFAREIRQAGLIKTGGRGTSAAQMDFQDATNLLIAVNTARTIREAPLMVAKFRALQAWENEFDEFLRPELRKYARPRKLIARAGQALEEVLRAVAGNTAPGKIPAIRRLIEKPLASGPVIVKLSFFRPDFKVQLSISVLKRGVYLDNYVMSHPEDLNLWFRQTNAFKPANAAAAGDRTEIISIGSATIQAIARSLGKS